MKLNALNENREFTNELIIKLSQLFGYLNTATLGIVGLIVVFSSAYSLAMELKKDKKNENMNPIIANLLAFSSYFIMVPNNVNIDYTAAEVIEGFSISFFSFEGMFTGLIVGMLAVY